MKRIVGATAIVVAIATSSIALVGVVDAAEPVSGKAKFFCNVNGLSAVERTEYRALIAKLKESVVEVQELDDGFRFRTDAGRLDLAGVSRWVALERRCCPFFRFAIEVEPEGGPVWLRLTGVAGVKAFIKTEMGQG